MNRLMGYLRLMRPANIITAITDILAGVAIAGSMISITYYGGAPGTSLGRLFLANLSTDLIPSILWLILSTVGLYGGGVVLNDVFDAALDKKERPERPIPSGLIPRKHAAIFGIILLVTGVAAAALSSQDGIFSLSAKLAAGIAIASVCYDKWTKHSNFFGPLNMGLCRALNLLLGMSLMPFAVGLYWLVAIIPMVYIVAVTMISRGEVHGGKKTTLYAAMVLYLFVILTIVLASYQRSTVYNTMPIVLIFILLIFPSLVYAIQKPEGTRVRTAVKSGVIALIAMNSAWAAAFGDIYFALLILLLFPLSLLLSRLFAVT